MIITPAASSSLIACPDSVNPWNLPPGFPAYLGYTDGEFPTAAELRRLFPDAELILLTVTGETTSAAHGARVAPGTDAEPGDLTAAQAAHWAASEKIGEFPVIYASVAGAPGYGMRDVMAELTARGIGRQEVRLLSAHYGAGPHICGPDSCRLISTDMDGTQWTDKAAGLNETAIDMSMLAGDFFGQLTETETLVQELGTVHPGQTGQPVRTVQGLLVARGRVHVAVDGVYGPDTTQQVKVIQHNAGLAEDGIVGPQTWPVLLGVA